MIVQNDFPSVSCNPTDNLCSKVGLPTLIFAIVQIIGLAIFLIVTIIFLLGTCGYSEDSKDEDENEK